MADGRARAAQRRDRAGRRRDTAARTRDRAASDRDAAAAQRDLRAEQRRRPGIEQHESDAGDAGSAAASDRDRSRVDRAVAAADREQAQHDRSNALTDRAAAALDRRHASVDGLTGVYCRQAGMVELERDMGRVARTGHQMVLAFVDVDHLKMINDTHGHAAGDRILYAVATTLQAALRSFDLIIRYGGDEFVCGLRGVDLKAAGPRLHRVNRLLALRPDRCSVTIGVAAWQAGESTASLIDRADADLYRQRQHRAFGPDSPCP